MQTNEIYNYSGKYSLIHAHLSRDPPHGVRYRAHAHGHPSSRV
jgi:hypothetical protein